MKITIDISDTDKAILENDLLDIEDWVKKAVEGKINSCKKRLVRDWQPKLFADPQVESIPANTDDFVRLVQSRADYKSRGERVAEEGR